MSSCIISRVGDFLDELERLERELQRVGGISSRYAMGPRMSADGLPLPEETCSGYAINNLVQTAKARLGKRDL